MTSNPHHRALALDRVMLSTLIAIVSGAFSAGGTWMAMSKDIERMKEDLREHVKVDAKQDASLDTVESEVTRQQQQFTERIHTLDMGQAIILEQLKEIRAAQERMDKNLEKLANGKARELGIGR